MANYIVSSIFNLGTIHPRRCRKSDNGSLQTDLTQQSKFLFLSTFFSSTTLHQPLNMFCRAVVCSLRPHRYKSELSSEWTEFHWKIFRHSAQQNKTREITQDCFVIERRGRNGPYNNWVDGSLIPLKMDLLLFGSLFFYEHSSCWKTTSKTRF